MEIDYISVSLKFLDLRYYLENQKYDYTIVAFDLTLV